MRTADYGRSVFLNCPFDDEYVPLFEAAVFAIMDCGFQVRCANESADASAVRINKIYELVRSCRLGVHDLSRTELDQTNELPRFNMPLELGIFLGAKFLGDERQRRKECLIFDKERYRYQKYISDVAGQDIATHQNDPRTLISRIRDWLSGIADVALPGGSVLWDRYQRFRSELVDSCRRSKQRPEELTFTEYVRYVDAFRPSKDDVLITKNGDERRMVNPTPAEIRQALKQSKGHEDFIAIYEKSGSGLSFMQTIGGQEAGFVLEYQEGSVDKHFVCPNSALSLEEVVKAIVLYSSGDESWRTAFSWEPMEV